MPMLLMLSGMAAKGVGVAIWQLSHSPAILKVLTTYDPIGVRLSELVLARLFDLRGIAPPEKAVGAFEGLLILSFGLQCLAIGLAAAWITRLRRQRRSRY